MAKKNSVEIEASINTRQAQEETRKLTDETRRLEAAAKKAAEALTRLNQSAIGRKTARAAKRYDADLQDPAFDDFERLTTNRAEADKMRRAFRSAHGMPEESHTERALQKLRGGKDSSGLHGPFWEHPAFTKPANVAAGAVQSAWGVAKGTLGVAAGAAGIGGIVSVISHAFSEYKSKIGDQETLFKRTGGGWTSLGQSIEELGKRVSVNAAEAGRLASSFQRLSGATDTGLIGRAGSAGSLARSLGMGPEAGVTALGRAEFMGFGGSEGKQRQFANLIGQTIADGNMLGSSEKVFEDILKHIQGVEENTGNLPSDIALAGFASLRSAMYNQNPAMKGGAGDSAISKAQAFVSGKGGLWNEAFLARAFDKELRGSSDQAVAFDFLKGANMFDTVGSVFGNGSQESILDQTLRRLDLETEAVRPNATAEDKLRYKASVMGMGGNPQLMKEFLKSYGAVKGDRGFGEWSRDKFDFFKNPGAMGGAVSLYQAQNDPEKLKALARQYTEGDKVKTSQADKDRINAAMGDPGQLAVVMQEVIAKQGEAGNEAEKLRDEIAELNNTLANNIGPKMVSLATNLASFSNASIRLFNRVFGGPRGFEHDPDFTGPPSPDGTPGGQSIGERAFGPDGWTGAGQSILDPLADSAWGKGKAPSDWLSENVFDPLADAAWGKGKAPSDVIAEEWSKASDWLKADPVKRGVTRAFGGIISPAGATMGAGDYPGEGLQELPKYHDGGIAGMRPDDVPAILKFGEEIIPTSDPRHRSNALITPGFLTKTFGVAPKKAAEIAGPMSEALKAQGITSKNEVAAFIAQAMHETGGMKWMSEIWGPTKAQKRYQGRGGNTQPGDNFRFRGRGFFHLTFRDNYKNFTNDIREIYPDAPDFEKEPDLIATDPKWATASALWYWKKSGMGRYAKAGNWRAVSGLLNAGSATAKRINGLPDRLAKTDAALRNLGEEKTDVAVRQNPVDRALPITSGVGSSPISNYAMPEWPYSGSSSPQITTQPSLSSIYAAPGMSRLPQQDAQSALAPPGMTPLPASAPIASSLPLTSSVGQPQANPINATLTVHYANGRSQVVATQPIAGNPATPGMRAQPAYGVPG